MTAKLRTPHLLLASGNCMRMRSNIAHLVTRRSLQLIDVEINRNVASLFALGENHFNFAVSQANAQWRQKVSRLYYGAYNVQRAIRLKVDGSFSTDSSDHKEIGKLPQNFPDINRYSNQLGVLRDDRNLADYSHESTQADLVLSLPDAQVLVTDFIWHSRQYLQALGVGV